MSEEIRFAFREFASRAAAYSALALELEPHTRTVLNKADREALARVMLATTFGAAETAVNVSWRHDTTPDGRAGDLLYRITH